MPAEPAFRPSSDLESIITLADPVRRNLFITQRYHDLSHGLRDTIDPGNANWSTFATWASKTAGETIRDEEVPKSLRTLLAEAEKLLAGLAAVNEVLSFFHDDLDVGVDHLLDPIQNTLADVSNDIAVGNLKVFRELAPIFDSFIVEFKPLKARDDEKLRHWVARLTPGPVTDGGQDLLRDAFTDYYEAKFELDHALRAQRLLSANCQIGLHEQTRLQPEIEAALTAPVRDLIANEILAIVKKLIPGTKHDHLAEKLTAPLEPVLDQIEIVFRRLTTRYLMNLTLPLGERISLAEDVAPERGTSLFPPTLERISGPPHFLSLLERYDRASLDGDSSTGSGAVDWASIPDRMNFIINLFRSRQQDEVLFTEPFTSHQRESLSEGLVPSGQL
jgi:hypothetical protein